MLLTSTLLVIVLCFSFWTFSSVVFGQLTPPVKSSEPSSSVVSVSASVSVPVTNQTLKAKGDMLRSSVISLLNSGPNVLKTPEVDQPDVKSNIVNKVNNDTQNVQGIEATNAIIGVEINKALKNVVSAINNTAQSTLVTIQTSSTCKPLSAKVITCDNTVVIK